MGIKSNIKRKLIYKYRYCKVAHQPHFQQIGRKKQNTSSRKSKEIKYIIKPNLNPNFGSF